MSGMNILTCDCTCPTEGVDCVCDVTVDEKAAALEARIAALEGA